QRAFYEVLGKRYIVFGEWMYAKHSIYYDALTHYFQEFDILDRESGTFLDTPSRHALLADLPIISVPVLCRGTFKKITDLTSLVGSSNYIHEDHITLLVQYCQENGLDANTVCSETDPSLLMEGLYLKIEDEGKVVGRLKYVRLSFLQQVLESGTHWLNRPIVPNRLSYPLDAIYDDHLPQGFKTIVKENR
ncbi:MAG: RNA ligase family protein, partial [Planctomycetia bacterium]|nr:RNA ligase family protein [Planctomycetia bacterium]